MVLLFVGGVMNLLWISVLALLVLLERLTPFGQAISIVAGVVCMDAGLAMLYFM
jgi:predicted metal-binding membrane protein